MPELALLKLNKDLLNSILHEACGLGHRLFLCVYFTFILMLKIHLKYTTVNDINTYYIKSRYFGKVFVIIYNEFWLLN